MLTGGTAPYRDAGGPALAAVAGSQLAAFGVVALLALVLGPGDVGRYALAYAVFALFCVLTLSGFRNGVVHSVGRAHCGKDPARLRGAVLFGVAVPTAFAAVCAGLLLVLAP